MKAYHNGNEIKFVNSDEEIASSLQKVINEMHDAEIKEMYDNFKARVYWAVYELHPLQQKEKAYDVKLSEITFRDYDKNGYFKS